MKKLKLKKHFIRIFLVIFIFFSLTIIFSDIAYAADIIFRFQIPIPGQPQIIEIDGDSLGLYIANLYKFAVGALAIISVVMIMIGGFQWLMSAGRSEHVTSAKDKIFNAIIGLVLALTSYLLLNTINPNLVKFQSLSIDVITPQTIKNMDPTGCCSYEVDSTKVCNVGITNFNCILNATNRKWIEGGTCSDEKICQAPLLTIPAD